MEINTLTKSGFTVIRVFGDIDRNASGRLLDALVSATEDGSAKVILDLSGVRFATQAGIHGIIVAAKLLKTGRGALRICGASLSVESLLRSLGFNHLLKFDPSLNVSITVLSSEGLKIGEGCSTNHDNIGRQLERGSLFRQPAANSQYSLSALPRKTGTDRD